MKKHIITFGTALLFVTVGFAVVAQDDAIDPQVAARLAARRAAEAAGTEVAPAAPAAPVDTAAAAPAVAPTVIAATDPGATNAATDPDEIRRKAALAAAEKEVLAATVNLPASQASFKIITERNIFDPRRVPNVRPLVTEGFPVAPVRTYAFYLGGTSHILEKGWVSFFDGDGVPAYPPTRCVGDMINEFKIVDITNDQVTLVNTKSTNAEPIVLEPYKGMSRSDNGPWRIAYSTPVYGTVARAQPPPDLTPGAPPFPSPVLQQIMGDDGSPAYSPYNGYQDDGTGAGGRTGRRRGQPGGGGPGNGGGGGGRNRGGGRGGAGGGFGGADTGGGFGGGGFGGGTGGFGGGGNANAQFAPPTTVDPNAPVDPAVLARLAARRAAEQ